MLPAVVVVVVVVNLPSLQTYNNDNTRQMTVTTTIYNIAFPEVQKQIK